MIKHPLFLPLVFVVLAFAVFACGGNGDSAATAAPVPATATVPPTAIGEVPTATLTGPAASMQTSATKASAAGDESEGSSASPTSTGAPQEALSTVEVVKILKPSVVQIVTEISAMGAVNQPAPSRGVGTGIILDQEGHILTNNHVIRGARSIMVTLNNGDSFPAELIGGDANTDTAVIKIDADGLQPATLGRSADLEVGAAVIAIGHALGLPGGPTVSKGVVSALGRSIDVDPRITMVDLIQTDASINPGNSGGPLANGRAEVIGINTAVIAGSQGIGFAINIDDAQFIAEQLLARGYVDRGFLGISPINLSPALSSQAGVPIDEGILIVRVVPDSAADLAGLEAEDVIVQMGGESVANTGRLSKFLVLHPPGETVEVVFYRGRREMRVQLTLGERPGG